MLGQIEVLPPSLDHLHSKTVLITTIDNFHPRVPFLPSAYVTRDLSFPSKARPSLSFHGYYTLLVFTPLSTPD